MRYRLLETLRQYGEEQMELRGETVLLRDRHAAYYADSFAEMDVLVRGPRQIEASERMSIEWDNLRAAHLWALAQDDLDLAERLVEASFLHAVFIMRHEHAAMLQRTVQLGDERGRPSTTMLGMLSYWLDMQGDSKRSLRFGQRGIDVAPSPDHPHRALCWFAFAGATAVIAPGSPEAVAAFQHEAASVANMPDLDHDWFALVNLTDASLHADPTATPALRQQVQRLGRSCAVPSTDHVRPSILTVILPQRVPSRLRRGDHRLRADHRDRPRPAVPGHRPALPRHGVDGARRARRRGPLPCRARRAVRDPLLAEDLADPRVSHACIGDGGSHRTSRRGPRLPRRALARVGARALPSLPRSWHASSSTPTAITPLPSSEAHSMSADELVTTAIAYSRARLRPRVECFEATR